MHPQPSTFSEGRTCDDRDAHLVTPVVAKGLDQTQKKDDDTVYVPDLPLDLARAIFERASVDAYLEGKFSLLRSFLLVSKVVNIWVEGVLYSVVMHAPLLIKNKRYHYPPMEAYVPPSSDSCSDTSDSDTSPLSDSPPHVSHPLQHLPSRASRVKHLLLEDDSESNLANILSSCYNVQNLALLTNRTATYAALGPLLPNLHNLRQLYVDMYALLLGQISTGYMGTLPPSGPSPSQQMTIQTYCAQMRCNPFHNLTHLYLYRTWRLDRTFSALKELYEPLPDTVPNLTHLCIDTPAASTIRWFLDLFPISSPSSSSHAPSESKLKILAVRLNTQLRWTEVEAEKVADGTGRLVFVFHSPGMYGPLFGEWEAGAVGARSGMGRFKDEGLWDKAERIWEQGKKSSGRV